MQLSYQDYYGFIMRPLQFPRSFYLMGQIYEKLNDSKSAMQSYQKLLDLWKDADKNIPELIDTKKRLARLKGLSSK